MHVTGVGCVKVESVWYFSQSVTFAAVDGKVFECECSILLEYPVAVGC